MTSTAPSRPVAVVAARASSRPTLGAQLSPVLVRTSRRSPIAPELVAEALELADRVRAMTYQLSTK